MDEQQILRDAKTLITQKRYSEARQLLKGIPQDPTAQKWLAKLDEIAPPVVSPFILDDDDPLLKPDENLFSVPSRPSPNPLGVTATSDTNPFAPPSTRPASNPTTKPTNADVNAFAAAEPAADINPFAPPPRPASNPRSTANRPATGPLPNNPFAPPTPRPSSNPLGASPQPPDNPFDDADDNPFATPDANAFSSYEIVPVKPNASLALLQNSGDRTFEKNTRRVSKNLQTRQAEAAGQKIILRAGLIGFLVAILGLGGFGVGGGFGNLSLSGLFGGKDETFETDAVQLTYSDDWHSVDLDSRQDCRDVVGECILFLQARGNAVAARLQNLALLQGNHQTTINVLWDGYQRANVGLHMVGNAISLKIDGQDAVQWYMTWRSPEGLDMYGLVLYMPTATSVLEFSAWGNSQAIFADEYPHVEAIIRSVRIKQPPR